MAGQRTAERLRGHLGDYLRQRGLSLRKPFRCLNPEHEDRHPSMSYNARAGNVHCFACGATYDLFDLVGMDYNLDRFPDRLEKTAQLFGLPPEPPVHLAAPPPERRQAPPPAPADRRGELEALRREAGENSPYLEARGITAESIRRFGLFEQGNRVYLPVFEEDRCTGWCARGTGEDVRPRYKNSPGSLGVWNGDILGREGRGESLYITEGILDAVCLEQLGRRAVALCGSQNVDKLLRRCQLHARTAVGWRFVACGDGDEAGRRMNRALEEGLSRLGMDCRVLELEGGDVNALYLRDREALEALLEEKAGSGREAEYLSASAAGALDSFFAEREKRAGRQALPTGIAALDRVLDGGLHPGLYVLGAISSLGKTSLALQIADTIAAGSRDVLYISLEQSRFELIAKSLSRISAGLAGPECLPFTARQLLSGQPAGSMARQQLLLDSREAYGAAATRLFLREGMADIGAGDVRRMVREHLEVCGRAPMVVVDYLQILSPADLRATDKQNVDRAVVELKRLSRDFDIPVLAVSSFNRENYRAAASMEAFKESGAVEYSADVLLGLQLLGAGSREFDVNAAKAAVPRRLELVLLKNRNGVPYAKIPLLYDPRYGLFQEGKARAVRGAV